MKHVNSIAMVLGLVLWSVPVPAQETQGTSSQLLFRNVQVFNGIGAQLSGLTNVLVEGTLIAAIGPDVRAGRTATVIDGGGRVLMPGLSNTHVHIAFASLPQMQVMTGLPEYNVIHSTVDARAMLMRGITSVRDMGGNTFGLKEAIDQGLVPGPRIYPSGALISQTGGHGDFRWPNEDNPRFGGQRGMMDQEGSFRVVDGVPEMLAAARENLRHGASHIKLAAGGGYASPSDPLTGNQFTYDEIKAAVDAATDWGTYVTIHAYHPSSVNRAIDAGVMDVGHGQLLDKATLQRMADKGAFLSTQPFTVCNEPQLDAFSNAKLAEVCKGTAFVYATAKTIPGLKVTYGTDLFGVSETVFEEQVQMMDRLLTWYTPVEILRMATSTAGELFAMSGLRNPYPDGALGVVKPGAYADLLLVGGNPLEDLGAVTNADNLKIIVKDGVIYKNTVGK